MRNFSRFGRREEPRRLSSIPSPQGPSRREIPIICRHSEASSYPTDVVSHTDKRASLSRPKRVGINDEDFPGPKERAWRAMMCLGRVLEQR